MSATTTDQPAPVRRGPATPAPSMARLVRVELRKAVDTRAGFWLLVTVGVAALAVVLLQLFFAETDDRSFTDYFATSQFPVALLLPVLGILLVTSEWSQRTAMTTFALVPDRSRVLAAKVVAGSVLAVLGVLAAGLAAALATLLTPVFTDDPVAWGATGAQAGQVVLVQVISVLSGVGFGMLLLSSPLAIVLYFVLPTAFTILSNAVSALQWLRDWFDLGTTSMPMYTGELDAQGWCQVATSVALWTGLPLVLGWLRIERSEIS